MVLPLPCHLHGNTSATHHTTHDAICGKYNFGKYNIFHRPDETILFLMVKGCLHLKTFCFLRTENFVLLMHAYKQNEKPLFCIATPGKSLNEFAKWAEVPWTYFCIIKITWSCIVLGKYSLQSLHLKFRSFGKKKKKKKKKKKIQKGKCKVISGFVTAKMFCTNCSEISYVCIHIG